ncbi:thiamine pyrophosphate-binding protein [Cyanobium sp. ATX-6F1]|uniref:thiamine pyrophosphate-binding protein n=1 Tax=Cyanobium sp. ATX 6F1 TaxID=2823702 RepID=UPI0020CCC0D8|nr:thiamine pyrophosphate-binding protein [Cyanobium sp. ATX 6F1]MCP9915165.1 thiamine pyrophosphate-binding protein [Cyanobium sp. ATX 6F1]
MEIIHKPVRLGIAGGLFANLPFRSCALNVAEFLLQSVINLGTDTAYCLTGGMATHLHYAAANSSLNLLYCNHEQACVASADGYAKAFDYLRPGLAIVTSGPGVTNIATSIASAYHDSVPVVILAGQVKSADINRFGLRSHGAQEVPSLDVIRPIAKSVLRYDPAEIDDESLALVLAKSVSGRMGPVLIEVPLDFQAIDVDNAKSRLDLIISIIHGHRSTRLAPSEGSGHWLQTYWRGASRPVLFIGNGTRISGVSRDRIRSLAETLNVPTLFSWPSADLLDSGHGLNFGCPGGLASTHSNRILQNADAVIFLGARLDLLTTGFNPSAFGRRAHRLVIDVDGLELEKFAKIEFLDCCHSDASEALDWLRAMAAGPVDAHEAWFSQCLSWKQEDERHEMRCLGAGGALNARNISLALTDTLSNMIFVTTASGYAIEGIARFFRPANGNRIIYGGHSLGSMGLGLPTAVGAAAARVGRVVCLEGDGGLMLNVQELATIQANPELDISIILLNNGGYVSISRSQLRTFGEEFGASPSSGLSSPDLEQLSSAFGLKYRLVDSPRALMDTLEEIKQGGSRLMINLMIDADGYRGPSIVTRFRDDGTPYSTDLEEVSWTV